MRARERGFTLLEVILALGLAFLLLTTLLMAWQNLQKQGDRLQEALRDQEVRELLADRLTLMLRRFCPQTVRRGALSGSLLQGDDHNLVLLSRVSWFSTREGVFQFRLQLDEKGLHLRESGWSCPDGTEWEAGELERSEDHLLAGLAGFSWSYWVPEQQGLGAAGWVSRVDALKGDALPLWIRLQPAEGRPGEDYVFRLGQ